MAPTFYDADTQEPLAPRAATHPLRPVAARPGPAVPTNVATLVMPVPAPYRLATRKPLNPPTALERLVPLRDWIVGLGREGFRIFSPDLTQTREMDSPSAKRVDSERGLIFGADVFGSLVARRAHDLAIAFRLNPTYPAGFDRQVLYVDGSKLLLVSVELAKRSSRGMHPPEVTMFEWFALGNVASVNADMVADGAAITAVTFSRTLPLKYAVGASGDPLVLAQPGHLVWLDHALKAVADVAIAGGQMPLTLDVDARGRALLVIRGVTVDHLWIVDRSGEQVCDVALAERSPDGIAPEILTGPDGDLSVITGRTVERLDSHGVERWRARLPEAPVRVTAGDKAGLLAVSGNALLRVDGDGHSDLLYEDDETLVSRPTLLGARILVATGASVLALEPMK